MKFGIRTKLFGASVALILSVGLATGLYLQGKLKDTLERRIEAELLGHARAGSAYFELADGDHSIATVDPLANRLGEATGSRITVIAPDGTVLGDSALTPAEVTVLENHGARPEVRQALRAPPGRAHRYSTTIDEDMLYVAVPFVHGDSQGVVRVAEPLAEVKATVGRFRVGLLAAGLIGLGVAVFMSGLASHFMSRTLRELVRNAREIASGQAKVRLDVSSSDELGGLAGSLNRMADELEQTVSTLAAERSRFGAVLDGMNEAVIALDQTRHVTLMNREALSLLGLDRAPIGELLAEVIRAPALHELVSPPVEAGQGEFDLPGRETRVLARVTPQPDSGGCIVVLHDVTDIRRLETIRRDFVANVSHELRTPVSIIRANAETLIDGAKDDPVHGVRLLEAVHRNAERLTHIIADLLDLSRLEAGRYQIEEESLSVAAAVEQAILSVERAAQEKQILLETGVADTLHVRADAKALDHVLVNLLDNAVKYTPARGRVRVLAKCPDDDHIRVEVQDNGPGIAPQHRARIFERFYRVDPGRSRDIGGTGLGLSIVRHLVEAMDGEVGMDPNEPRGSKFWVVLPRARASEPNSV